MTEKSDSAYPWAQGQNQDGTWNQEFEMGLTKREYAAIKIAAGLSVGCAGLIGDKPSAYAKGYCNAGIAERSVVLADALIAELAKDKDNG